MSGFGSSLFNTAQGANDAELNKQFGQASISSNNNASNNPLQQQSNQQSAFGSFGNPSGSSGFGSSLGGFGSSNTNAANTNSTGGFGAPPTTASNGLNGSNQPNTSSFGSSLNFGSSNTGNTGFGQNTSTNTSNTNNNSNSNSNSNNGGDTISGWGAMSFGQEEPPQQQQVVNSPQQMPQTQEQIQSNQADLSQYNPIQRQSQQARPPMDQQEEKFQQNQQNQQQQRPNILQSSGIDERLQGAVQVNGQGGQYMHEKFNDFKSMGVLRNELLDGVEALGWKKPSKIQGTVLPMVLNRMSDRFNGDVIGQAHHGSGKTGAFVLNVLQRVDNSKRRLQAIILSHSRELATQTKSVVIQLGRYMQGLETILAVPAINDTDRVPLPNQWTAQVCVGTPGVILYNVLHYDDKYKRPKDRRGNVTINMPDFLRDFKILVVDEADEFFKPSDMQPKARKNLQRGRGRGRGGKGFGGNSVTMYDQLLTIAKMIKLFTKPQILLYSATLPPDITDLVSRLGAQNPFFVKVEKEKLKLENVKNVIVEVSNEQNKFEILKEILINFKLAQCIIFTNTVKNTKQLHYNLANNNDFQIDAALLVGQMDKKDRDEHMEAFRLRETKCLIASNVIARGIDVPTVNLVVNYEIPYSYENGRKTVDSETFMHRVGRTGRYGTQGVCINFVDPVNVNDSKRLLEDVLKEYDLLNLAESINGVGINEEQLEREIKTKIAKWIE